MEDIYKVALQTLQKNKQALVFVSTRASAEKTAETIAKLTEKNLPELENSILKAASTPTKQCKKLSKCVRKGIAFHHAGLLQKQKTLIEDNFRNGTIKIICATPTLAAGLSLPAYRVLVRSLKRYSGRWGMDWIPVLEYLQMAGRAGRPEYESEGEAITFAKNEIEKQEIYERYICGEPEDIYSKLAVEPVLRTYLLSLISSGIIRNEKSMYEFFNKTFWAFQFQDMPKLQQIMEKMLHLLNDWQLILLTNTKQDDFSPANTMNNNEQKMRPTLLGKRVSELYLDPLTARHLLDSLKNFDETKNSFSLLQMISNTLEMRPLLRVKVREQEKINEGLMKHYDMLLKPEPSSFDIDYDDFFNSIKTALFFDAWINEKNEEFLLETYGVRPGEIRVKIEAANWLLYAAHELADIMDYKHAQRMIKKLRIQVRNGVKEELLPLLKLKGVGRVRARKLYLHGIKDLGSIKKADITTLLQLVGKAIAVSIKQQVGEEVKEIPKGTRKGQLSLEKY
ncbi:hypothetical protein HOI26_02490 [Candidatus Woesearchaeota archaeon]|nr:hypothetical protein [Candidatus Woesearchaeota archaeon]